jgi:uncharacterized protein YraI
MHPKFRVIALLITSILIITLATLAFPTNFVSAAQSDNSLSTTVNQVASGNPWNAQFFNNQTFTSPIVATLSYPAGPLQNNWGLSAPAANVIADGWSARFTRVVEFPLGGSVRFEARADDTVTVYVDGAVVTASATYFIDTTYAASITVAPGWHTITVDYTDIVAQAYVFVNWSGGGISTTPPPSTSVTGTVATASLNFRNGPSLSATKVGTLNRGASYVLLGRDTSATWAYLESNGVRGWVSAAYLTISGNFNGLPILGGSNPAPSVSVGTVVTTARPIYNVVIRSCASSSCTRLGLVRWQVQVDVFGQSADGLWIKIRYTTASGTVIIGWTYKSYFNANGGLALPALPTVQ